MEGAWRRGTRYYLCRFRTGNAAPEGHPATAYVREDHVVGHLDRWLAQVFDPDRLDERVDALVAAANEGASDADTDRQHAIADATVVVAACDEELANYRAALAAPLPSVDSVHRLRWHVPRLAEAMNERRCAEGLTWQALADQLGVYRGPCRA